MQQEFRHFFISLKRLYKKILSIHEGSDIDSTIAGIKKDISFRGPTAWILIFSILIASIGLNANSPAVIIGAMLISPLMGPILGVGLSLGTHDYDTLIRSLKNLGIAVSISLITSTLYFIVTPLNIEQTELLARTKPTILDVLVALFGGFAGIIAGSRREKTNVIPGVAIATALMPPLCTAGYGLAQLNFRYFLGAFYLFFINSVFISISTFLVVKYLNFPLVNYIQQSRLNRYRWIVTIFLIITIVPSGFIFWNVIQETRYKIAVEDFIKNECNFDGSELISSHFSYADTISMIHLYYIGKEVKEEQLIYLQEMLMHYGISGKERFPLTDHTKIQIHQENDDNYIDIDKKIAEFDANFRLKLLEDIYTKNEKIIQDKDLKIQLLENELVNMKKSIPKDTFPYAQIFNELTFHYHMVEDFSYSKSINIKKDSILMMDTIPLVTITFDKNYRRSYKTQQLKEIQDWLKIRLKDTLIVVNSFN